MEGGIYGRALVSHPCLTPSRLCSSSLSPWQGLQRRATPHPSELKVMKRGIEERRNEAFVCKPDPSPPSPSEEVGEKGLAALDVHPSWQGELRAEASWGRALQMSWGLELEPRGQVTAEGYAGQRMQVGGSHVVPPCGVGIRQSQGQVLGTPWCQMMEVGQEWG